MLFLRFAGAAGVILLALMLIANAFLPTPDATPAQEHAANMPTIRITAARKGPELVQIDTSLPTMSAPPQAFTEAAPLPPPPVREARAEAPDDQVAAAKVADVKPEAKSHKTHRRAYAQQQQQRGYPYPYYAYAQQQPMMQQRPHFAGLFGSWWFR